MEQRKRPWRTPLLVLLTLLLAFTAGQAALAASTSAGFEDLVIPSSATSVTIPVKVDGLSPDNALAGLYMEIEFDNTRLAYTGLAAGSSAPGLQCFGNVQGNRLLISGFTASPVNTGGEVLKLQFNVNQRGNPVQFKIVKCEINDAPVGVKNGTISFQQGTPAGNLTVFFADVTVASDQSEFTVPVSVKGIAPDSGVAGVLLEVSYNPQAVGYAGMASGSVAPGFQYFDNDKAGTLLITGFAASPVTSDGDILKLKFKIKDRQADPGIKITRAQLNDLDVPVENGTVTVGTGSSTTGVYFTDLTVPAGEESFTLPVKVRGLTNDNALEGLLLEVSYDSTCLSYEGVEPGTMAAGFQFFANDAGGTVKISGFTASPVKADGEILRLKFRVLKRVSPLALAIKSAQVNDRDVPCASGRITLEEEGASSDALGLASFTVNGNRVTVSNPDQLTYTVQVEKVGDLKIEATPLNKNDFVRITTKAFDQNGIATAIIQVMSAADNTKIKTYTITIVAKTLSSNATLKYLAINGRKLPGFSKDRLSYDYAIPDCVKTLDVKARPEDPGSTVRISGNTLDDKGNARVEITVIAPDGSTTRTYTVNITSYSEGGFVIVAMSPGEEEDNVPVDTNIVIDFSQPLHQETVDENSVYVLNQNGTAIPAKVKLSMDKKRVTIDPISDLAEEYEYTVVVTTNLYNQKEEPFPEDVQWVFKTGKRAIEPVKIPAKPTDLKGRATSAFSITWTWKDNSDNEQGFLLKDENGSVVAKIDRANTTVYVEKGLNPNTQYKRTVSAYVIDELGNMVESEPSLPKTVKTMAYKVKPPVIFARVTEITSEKIIWRWYRKGEPGMILKVYDKDMHEVGQVSLSSQKYEDYIEIDKNSKEFTRKFTIWDPTMNLESEPVSVSIVNPYYGTGRSLNPPLIKASSLRDGRVTITLKDRSRDEQGFRIYRVNAAGQVQELVKEVLTPDVGGINQNIGVELEGLDPATTYRYVAKAFNQTGEGDASEIVTVNE